MRVWNVYLDNLVHLDGPGISLGPSRCHRMSWPILNLRHALRQFVVRPGFTRSAIVILAVGLAPTLTPVRSSEARFPVAGVCTGLGTLACCGRGRRGTEWQLAQLKEPRRPTRAVLMLVNEELSLAGYSCAQAIAAHICRLNPIQQGEFAMRLLTAFLMAVGMIALSSGLEPVAANGCGYYSCSQPTCNVPGGEGCDRERTCVWVSTPCPPPPDPPSSHTGCADTTGHEGNHCGATAGTGAT